MTDLWRCTVCGQVSTVGRCCGEETREPWRPIRRKDEEETRRIEAVADRAEQLEAENERLRAEVERSERYAEQSERERLWAEERAERLAEALREISTLDYKNAATNGAAYEAVQIASRVLMNQEDRND